MCNLGEMQMLSSCALWHNPMLASLGCASCTPDDGGTTQTTQKIKKIPQMDVFSPGEMTLQRRVRIGVGIVASKLFRKGHKEKANCVRFSRYTKLFLHLQFRSCTERIEESRIVPLDRTEDQQTHPNHKTIIPVQNRWFYVKKTTFRARCNVLETASGSSARTLPNINP